MPVLTEIYVYPIKSCAGIALERATLLETGLEYDRNWMVCEADGAMLTQRTYPRMALIRTALEADDLVIDAPGMPTLRTPLRAEALVDPQPLCTTVWRDTFDALDTGEDTARWFSEFLQMPVRLARFAPATRRVVDESWTAPLTRKISSARCGSAKRSCVWSSCARDARCRRSIKRPARRIQRFRTSRSTR